MDGENNGKPYEQMDDFGGVFPPIFLVQHPNYSDLLEKPVGLETLFKTQGFREVREPLWLTQLLGHSASSWDPIIGSQLDLPWKAEEYNHGKLRYPPQGYTPQ